ncbi:MAG: SRPBCC domain-containing protein [Chloroflexota bacterium]|nr:SRPBCC domain-containing protein [Chloroflexota bacterium]
MTSITGDEPIRHVVRVDAPIEIVRTFFTDPERLVEWWPTRATIDARVGGELELEFDQKDGHTDRGKGTFTELGLDRIVLTWGFEGDPDLPPGSSSVEITLESDGLATVVRLEHRGLPQSHRRRHDDGWAYFLGRLSSAARSIS